MTTWMEEELKRIGESEELEISTRRLDGTLRNPVTIWVVRVDDEIYVRAYKGRNSPWFRAARQLHAGHILAGGVAREVTLVEIADPEMNNRIDEAYRGKYRRYPQYVAPMVTPEARAATIKLVPHSNNE